MDALGKPKIALPTGPIEPYLIQPENGPFMVMAYTFRGPDAARYAQALTIELRSKYKLPAYIFYAKVQPGHSNIRNIPPTSPPYVRNGEMAAPERYRNYDEAAVLVGDCKTIGESNQLLRRVKKLHPTTVEALPSIYYWRRDRGLSRALLTTNPLVPAQYLYPGKGNPMPVLKPGQVFDPSVMTAGFETINRKDPLIKQMNKGPHNIYKCAGPYVLQVAEFTGRQMLSLDGELPKQAENDLSGARGVLDRLLKPDPRRKDDKIESNQARRAKIQSPLAQAAEDAESMAEAISKSGLLEKSIRPYVYHDRFASRVYLGPFRGPDDPAFIALVKDPTNGSMVPASALKPADRQVSKIVQVSYDLMTKKGIPPLAPASQLTAVGKE
jgi:hypothetical protein